MGIPIARWIIVALGFLAAAYIVPGIEVGGFYIALVLGALWGIINLTVRPVLILLTLPINLLTFGLFTLVINGALLWFLASFVEQFDVAGFIAGVLGALVISLVAWLGDIIVKEIAQ